jgi:hypothetical protein
MGYTQAAVAIDILMLTANENTAFNLGDEIAGMHKDPVSFRYILHMLMLCKALRNALGYGVPTFRNAAYFSGIASPGKFQGSALPNKLVVFEQKEMAEGLVRRVMANKHE